jgi:uncharacterized protein (DUF1778 family)
MEKNESLKDTIRKPSGMQTRRRRQRELSNRPVFTYFTSEEKDVVEQAAAIRRQSTSAFVADAALNAALSVIREYNQKVSKANRPKHT